MKRKSVLLRALVLGGTIASGFALNSTDALAAEVEAEPTVTSEQGENENEQTQVEDSLQKMEDAVGVIEGDVVAENGYLEEATDAINKNEMTEEKAADISEKGQDVLEQAEEKAAEVKSEYEKIAESTEKEKAAFEEAAAAAKLEEYTEQCEQATTTEEKIAIIEESEEKASSDADWAGQSLAAQERYFMGTVKTKQGYEQDLANISEEISQAEGALEDAQEERDKIAEEMEALQHSIDLLDEEIAEYQKIADETIWAVDAYQWLDELKKQYSEELAKYEEKQREKEGLENEIEELKKVCEEREAEYLGVKEEYDKYQNECTKIEKKYESAKRRREEVIRGKEVLEGRLEYEEEPWVYYAIVDRLKSIEKELNNLDNEILDYEQKLNSLEHENSELVGRYSSAEENYNVANDELRWSEDELSGVNDEMAGSEKVQAELQEKLNADYDSLLSQYYTAQAQVNFTGEQRYSLSMQLAELEAKYIDICNTIEELKLYIEGLNDEYTIKQAEYEEYLVYYEAEERELAEFERYYKALLNYHQIAENYKNTLVNVEEAKYLLTRSETAYANVVSTYEELETKINDYTKILERVKGLQNDAQEVEGAAASVGEYFEEVKEAIEGDSLSNEAADEYLKKGEEAVNKAEEKNDAAKAEYEKIVEGKEADKKAFDEAAEAAGVTDLSDVEPFEDVPEAVDLTEYPEKVDEASTNEDKIALIEEAEEKLKPIFDKVNATISQIEYIEAQIKKAYEAAEEAEQIMKDTKSILDKYSEAEEKLGYELAYYERLKGELAYWEGRIASCDKEIKEYQDDINAINEEFDELAAQVNTLTDKINKILVEIKELSTEKQELEEKLQKTTDEAEYKEIEAKIKNVNTKIEKKEKEKEDNENEVIYLFSCHAALSHDLEHAQYCLRIAQSDKNSCEDRRNFVKEDMGESEKKQAELSEYMNIDYDSIVNRNMAAQDDYYTALYEARLHERDLMSYDVDYFKEKKVALQNFYDAAENYKNSLIDETNAKALVERSEAAYNNAVSTYENLVNAVEEYKETHPEKPAEPEISETTTIENYTTNISTKVKDLFTGITAVVEANISTKVTKVVKTIKDVATKTTETIVTTKVDVIGTGFIKLYNRACTLITTLSGSVSLALDWVGGLLS